ncbi:hypothetical protein N9406_08390 [Verrucomicrobiales bacterium]|nr:hypothetical protein [Verrucomicrobiales bacterium]
MSPDYGLPLVTLAPYNYRYESLAELIAIFGSTTVTWPESRRPKSNRVIPEQRP